jgi:hypothetical protein
VIHLTRSLKKAAQSKGNLIIIQIFSFLSMVLLF